MSAWLVQTFGPLLIPAIIGALGAWLLKEIGAMSDEAQKWLGAHASAKVADTLDAGLATASGIMATLVNAAEHTIVEAAKKSGGNWADPATQKAIRDAVLADARQHILSAAPQLLPAFGAGLQKLLVSMLEDEVAKLTSKPTAPAAVTANPTAPAATPANATESKR